jgi:predicted ATPase
VRELVQWLEGAPPGHDSPDRLEIPEGVRQVIGNRLAALPEETRRVLTIAAVIGRDFSLAPLAPAAALDEPTLLEHLAVAEEARVVAPGAAGFQFCHPMIRDVLYEQLATATRVHLHQAIAEALEQLYTPRPIAPTNQRLPIEGPQLAELAHHFCEAALGGAIDKAVDYAVRAGDHAADLSASDEAARHYERALQLLERVAPSEQRESIRARLAALRTERA